jgi:hypothetical protein
LWRGGSCDRRHGVLKRDREKEREKEKERERKRERERENERVGVSDTIAPF